MIVILAVIALITTAFILGIIKDIRKGAFSASKRNIEKAAQLYYSRNSEKVSFDNGISYVELGTLMNEGYLDKDIENLLTKEKIDPSSKVLIYRKGNKLEFALQMYDEAYLNWYKEEMIKAVKGMNLKTSELPKEISLEELMDNKKVSELRLPTKLQDRCAGYVEAKLENNEVKYEAYVDCLTEASYFASHYVTYGGKYLDEFLDVKSTSDGGYIAVGQSNSSTITKYGTGNNGSYDAIIVKFNSKGEVEWSRNFGGSSADKFNGVVEVPDGYVVVGQTASNDGDIVGYKGGDNDAIIVKYNKRGEVVYKRCYGSSTSDVNGGNENFFDIIKDNNSYVIVGTIAGYGNDGDLQGVTGLVRHNEGIILKMDLNFNVIWQKFFVGSYTESFRKVIKASDNTYIVVGESSSNNYDMSGIGYLTPDINFEAIILKYDVNGNLMQKKSFRGERAEYFFDVTEVNDGFVAVGYSASSTYDMENLSKANNGYTDALIVKFDKNLSNIMWKKTFGGSNDDTFRSVISNNDEIVAVGSTKSADYDMQGIFKTKEGYKNAIIVKYDAKNGNVIQKGSFGGSNSEGFYRIAKTPNNSYIVVGNSYSTDMDLKEFNKGHQDALMVKYSNNLNLEKTLLEPVVLIDKIKKLVTDYGTEISLKYENLYTTNDPLKDLGNWCLTNGVYTNDNKSNYYYWCLGPFNNDDRKVLVEKEVSNGLKFYAGEHEYLITKQMDNNRNWIEIIVSGGAYTGRVSFSNLKLKFADGYVGSIRDAVNKGYIEPLVPVISKAFVNHPTELLPNVIDIINENGNTGEGAYPQLKILIKLKKSELKSIILTASKNSSNEDGILIYELRNFDMSITSTN